MKTEAGAMIATLLGALIGAGGCASTQGTVSPALRATGSPSPAAAGLVTHAEAASDEGAWVTWYGWEFSRNDSPQPMVTTPDHSTDIWIEVRHREHLRTSSGRPREHTTTSSRSILRRGLRR